MSTHDTDSESDSSSVIGAASITPFIGGPLPNWNAGGWNQGGAGATGNIGVLAHENGEDTDEVEGHYDAWQEDADEGAGFVSEDEDEDEDADMGAPPVHSHAQSEVQHVEEALSLLLGVDRNRHDANGGSEGETEDGASSIAGEDALLDAWYGWGDQSDGGWYGDVSGWVESNSVWGGQENIGSGSNDSQDSSEEEEWDEGGFVSNEESDEDHGGCYRATEHVLAPALNEADGSSSGITLGRAVELGLVAANASLMVSFDGSAVTASIGGTCADAGSGRQELEIEEMCGSDAQSLAKGTARALRGVSPLAKAVRACTVMETGHGMFASAGDPVPDVAGVIAGFAPFTEIEELTLDARVQTSASGLWRVLKSAEVLTNLTRLRVRLGDGAAAPNADNSRLWGELRDTLEERADLGMPLVQLKVEGGHGTSTSWAADVERFCDGVYIDL